MWFKPTFRGQPCLTADARPCGVARLLACPDLSALDSHTTATSGCWAPAAPRCVWGPHWCQTCLLTQWYIQAGSADGLPPGPWRPHALLSAPWALPPGLKLPSAPDQTLTLKAEASLCLLTAGPEHSRPMSSARLPRWLRCQQPGPASRPRRPPSGRVVR